MLKNAFLYRIALHELKKQPFSANQKVFFCRKLYALLLKASRFRKQNTACSNNFLLSSKAAFLRQKAFIILKPFLAGFKNRPFSQTKSLSFTQILPYCHPKQPFSTLRFPFQRPLTYCPPKNTAVLLISALNPYAVKPEPRTDSNHCRRYPAKLQLFTEPVT